MSKDFTMFNNTFIKSTNFLALPISSKLLYFYLLEDADTDGIVDAYMTLRVINCEITDWTNLIERKIIWLLEKPYLGFIPDYTIHNRNLELRWAKDSIYLPLLAEKYPNARIQRRFKNKNGKTQKKILSVSEYLKIMSLENTQITEIVTEKKLLPRNACSFERTYENSRELARTHENSRELAKNRREQNRSEENRSEKKQQQHTWLTTIGIDSKKADQLLELPHLDTLSVNYIEKIWEYAQKNATSNPTGYFIRLLETENLQLSEPSSSPTYNPNCPKCHGSGIYMTTRDDSCGQPVEVSLPCDCWNTRSKEKS